ncbi:PAS domain-containing protein [Blastopirellula sp. JC732]|uniref:histidine kinase n=1 Tax=Blastopirellula sediminis TaxID=2894196 RepID=A0A9X1MKI7_9BACT|nr:ATP-binding protein [Blastopirellula sediminis]MCC9608717.1 PAS domain-containing protein [Blastopirellula sediminis]MCC9628506.1 PAS domain-containing protein [Blastopirellula sediminis]
MLQSRIGWALFFWLGLIIFLFTTGAIALFLLDGMEHSRLRQLDALQTSARLFRRELETIGLPLTSPKLDELVQLQAKESGLYITVANEDGNVLIDSRQDAARMENVLRLSEFKEAQENGFGEATSDPQLPGRPFHFIVLPLEADGKPIGFVRVGQDIEAGGLHASYHLVVGSMALGLVILTGAYFIARRFEERVVAPVQQLTRACAGVERGDYTGHVWAAAEDELGDTARQFTRMQAAIDMRVDQLTAESNRLKTVLGSMVEGVIAVDAQQRVLLANRAVRKLLAIRADDVVGRPLLELTRNRSLDDSFRAAIASDEPYRHEFEVSTTPRRILSLQANRLPGDPCPGVVMVLHDVTELRRLENMRREFVSSVSHELKTPLAAVRAYTETLQLGAVEDVENRGYFLSQIMDSADRLNDLIQDMLHLARIESREEAFDITEVPVAGVIEKCLHTQRDTAAARQIALRIHPPDEEISVLGDEEGVRTILSNLIDNAVKYTSEGGTVDVAWGEEGSHVAITVKDTGIGIPQAALERIFERFYRVDKARSREMGGTGLGLSIVKHTAQAMEGEVTVQSQVGEGSTFTVRLPRG